MSKRNITLAGAGLLIVALLLYQVPAINSRLSWRFEVAKTYVKNVLNPVGSAPTAIPNTPVAVANIPTATSPATPTLKPIATAIPPTATLTPPLAQALLASPPYEKQTANNCGQIGRASCRERV